MTEPTLFKQTTSSPQTPSNAGENDVKEAAVMPSTEAFMYTAIKFKWGSETPANMLRHPGADAGLDLVTDEWIDEIIASDDPDTELMFLINHLTGLLTNVKLIRKHYNLYLEQYQQAAA